MKISSIMREFLTLRAGHADTCDAWIDDPYAHPDIAAMSERQRADLPPVHMPAPEPVLRGGTPSAVPTGCISACA